MQMKRHSYPFWVWYLFLILPFLAGGFYTYLSAVTAFVLLTGIIMKYRENGFLQITVNSSSILCFSIWLGYCITPLWAADKGMAMMGNVRYFPVVFLSVLLMQYPIEARRSFLSLIPGCGVGMVIISCILWMFPSTKELVLINSRLSGFLQYPNTFAAFLLIGIAILGTHKKPSPILLISCAILICGIFFSGSRTSAVMLIFLLLFIGVFHKKLSPVIPIAAVILLAVFFIINGSQVNLLGRDIGSLFVRILYYKDALPIILQHPFGLGYLGYRALEATFQTSRYTVSFVHSGLLQLMLDIGWIPALLFVITIGKTLLSPTVPVLNKMVLLTLVGHCSVDFDLQFFLFWAVLLLCLDWESPKTIEIRNAKIPVVTVSAVALIICLWLGLGDFFHMTGKQDKALRVTPFHTDALVAALQITTDIDELDRLADEILSLNPTHSLACSAKANAAFARGDITNMILYKQKAIQLAPYTIEEYCDYIKKLYTVMELYIQSGDHDSAAFCLNKILTVPETMEAVAAKTDPLAYRTGNSTQMQLPDTYQDLLNALAAANAQP